MFGELLVAFLILGLALVLLVAEDLLPTGGALGILAGACLVGLLYLGFSTSASLGWKYLALEVGLVPVAYVSASWLLSKTGLGRLAALQPPESHEVDLGSERPPLDHLVGRTGRVLTPLRPSGMVDFDGRRLDGVAEQGMIGPGLAVMAVEVRSGRLIVREVLGESASEFS